MKSRDCFDQETGSFNYQPIINKTEVSFIMKQSIVYSIIGVLVGIFMAQSAIAQSPGESDVPRTISYQGMVSSATGARLPSGDYAVTVRLYADEHGQEVIWEGQYTTTVENGLLNLELGSGDYPLPGSSAMDRGLWIGIQVGDGPEMTPRTRLSAVPYALTVPDGSVTSDKLGVDYVSSIMIDGEKVTRKGSSLNITGGEGVDLRYDRLGGSMQIDLRRSGEDQGTRGDGEKGGSTQTPNSTVYWSEAGNSGTIPGINYVGTSDAEELEIHVNSGNTTANAGDKRVMLYDPQPNSPNLIGGYQGNLPDTGSAIEGATIGGGGRNNGVNEVKDDYGTIGGGAGNIAGDISIYTTIGSIYATVGGGYQNEAQAGYSTVGGGRENEAQVSYSTVGGGYYNQAQGTASAIPGGRYLRVGSYSFGYNGYNVTSSPSTTDLSSFSNIAYLGNVDLWIGNVDNTPRQLRFYVGNNGNFTYSGSTAPLYVGFKAPQALASTRTTSTLYTLPTDFPSTDGALLSSSTTGTLSWSTSSQGWALTGNSGTTPLSSGTGHYLGTSDAKNLVIATSGTERIGIASTGEVTVAEGLTVNGNVDATNGLDVTNDSLTVGGTKFTVDEATGNTDIDGTLTVDSGATVTAGGLEVSAGGAAITGNSSVTGAFNLAGTASALLLNNSGGTSGQVLLSRGGGATPEWDNIICPSAAWDLSGNEATTPGTGDGENYLGTSDAKNLVIATSGTERIEIASTGEVTVAEGLTVSGNVDAQSGLDVTGSDLTVGGTKFTVAQATGNTDIDGTLAVDGNTTLGDDNTADAVTVNGGLSQTGTQQVRFAGNVDATNGLDVTGADLRVGGTKFTVDEATGNTAIDGTLAVDGNTTLGDDNTADAVTVNGGLSQTGTQQVRFAGNVDAQSGLDVTGSDLTVGTNFTVDEGTGNTDIDGRLTVDSGATVTAGGLEVSAGGAAITGNSSVTGAFNLAGTASALLLNNSGGTSGQVLLSRGGGATPEWGDIICPSAAWDLSGNEATTPGTGDGENYLGTSDAKNLVIATNAIEAIRIGNSASAAGSVTIANGLTVSAGGASVTGDFELAGDLEVSEDVLVTGDLEVSEDVLVKKDLEVLEDVSVRGSFNLAETASALLLNNSGGTSGQVLLSRGGGATPEWGDIICPSAAWDLSGNEATTPGTGDGENYLGTSDAKNLVIATSGTERIEIASTGEVTVAEGLTVSGNVDAQSGLDVTGSDLTVGGTKFTVAQATGNTAIDGTLAVDGNTTLGDDNTADAVTVNGGLSQTGTQQVRFAGNVDATNGLDVTGADLRVGGTKFTVDEATGNTAIDGTLAVDGNTTLGDDNTADAVTVNGGLSQTGTQQVRFAGNVDAQSGLDVTGSDLTVGTNFTVDEGTGNTDIDGTLTVDGDATFDGNVDATNGLDVTGEDLTVGGTKFTVAQATGNTDIDGTLAVDGNTTLGDDNTADAVTVNGGLSQTGTQQVRFAGNVDATNGLDVTGADLRVGGTKFTVDEATGNTAIDGTLTVDGATTLSGNVDAQGGLDVTGSDLTVGGTKFTVAQATGNTDIDGTLTVDGNATFNDNVNATNGLDVTGTLTVDTLTVDGATTLSGNVDAQSGLDVTGSDLTVGGTKFTVDDVTGNTDIDGTLTVDGNTTLGDDNTADAVTVNGGLSQTGTQQVRFSGNVDAQSGLDVTGSDLTVGGTKFTVDDVTGNTDIDGTLTVDGNTTLGDDNTADAVTVNGGLSQTGTQQVRFSGNVDAQSGLDVTGSDLTVGGTKFTVDDVTGNTDIDGTLTVDGNTTLGDDNTADAVTVNGGLSQTGTQQVRFAGNVDAQSGLDVTGSDLTVGGTEFTVDEATGNTDIDGTLTVDGATTLSGNVDATNGLDVTGSDLTVGGTEFTVDEATGNTDIDGTLTVDGNTTLGDDNTADAVTVNGGLSQTGTQQVRFAGNLDAQSGLDVTGSDLTVGGTKFTVAQATGNTDIDGTLTVDGATTLSGNVDAQGGLDVTGSDLTVGGTKFTVAQATGNTDIDGTLTVDGNTTLGDDNTADAVTVNGGLSQTGTQQVRFAGNLDAQSGLDVTGSDLTVGGTKFTVAQATGNTDIDGTLTVDGATTLSGNVDAQGGLDVTGSDLTVGGTKFTVAQATGNTDIDGTLTVDSGATVTAGGLEVSAGGAAITGNSSVTGAFNLAGTASALLLNNSAGTSGQVLVSRGGGATPEWGHMSSASAAWDLSGNSGTRPGTNYVGTSDAEELEIHVNSGNTTANAGDKRVMLYDPQPNSPNLIGGYQGNLPDTGSAIEGATIGGGGKNNRVNEVKDDYGTIGGGAGNVAGGLGTTSTTDDVYSTVGGGYYNKARAAYSTVGGGDSNQARAAYSTVGGGGANQAKEEYSTVGGGSSNQAKESYSTVGGGRKNEAQKDFTTVGGGYANQAKDDYATVGGGFINQARADYSTVGGGHGNQAQAFSSTVGGGFNNQAQAFSSTVGGGGANQAQADYSTVGGGLYNQAQAEYSTVGGGRNNQADTASAIPGGRYLTVGDNSFGFNGDSATTPTETDISAHNQTAYFGNVDLWIGNVDSLPRQLRFYEGSSTDYTYATRNYVGFKAPHTVTTTQVYTLPSSAPATSPSLSILTGNNAGVLSWTSVLSVANGGTGTSTTPTPNGVAYGSSSGSFAFTAAGAEGQVLTSGAGGVPVWSTPSQDRDWSLTGNSGTTPLSSGTGHYLGTSDATDLVIATSGTERIGIASTGEVTVAEGLTVSGNLDAQSGLDVTGSDLTIGGTKFTVDEATGNTDIEGTLTVDSGATVSAGGLTVSAGGAAITGNSSVTGSFNLAETASALLLNNSAGTSGQVLVSKGGGATPEWGDISSTAWDLSGNSGTRPGTNYVGTSDAEELEIHVNSGNTTANAGDKRVMLYDPQPNSPNLIGGYQGNLPDTGSAIEGATIGGGGKNNGVNEVKDDYGTIGGGAGNIAGGLGTTSRTDDHYATVGGGLYNQARAAYSTVGGGRKNEAQASYSAVGGGFKNQAQELSSTVGGGSHNQARAASSTVGGGYYNQAQGTASAIPGGRYLTVGANSFGFSGDKTTTPTQTNISAHNQTAYFGNVNLWIGNVDGTPRQLRFYEGNSNDYTYRRRKYVGFKAPHTVTTTQVYTLPSSAPAASPSLSILTGNSAGSLSWTSVLSVANGGTGTSTTPTPNGVAYGSSSGSFAFTPAGKEGQVLTSGAGGVPGWSTPSQDWALTGNSGTTPLSSGTGHYLGTSDTTDLVIATSGTERIEIASTGEVTVAEGLTVSGNVDAQSGLDVTGSDLTVGGTKFTVDEGTGNTSIGGTLTVDTVDGDVTFNGNVDAQSGLDVTGEDLTVGGTKFTVDDATGNTSIDGTLTVDGATTLSGNVDAQSGLDVTGSDLTVGGTKFTVDDTTGNTDIDGTLTVDGGATVTAGGLEVSAGGAAITGNSSVTGSFNLAETASALLLNNSAGTSGQVLVSKGGGATPEWGDISSASAAWDLSGNSGTRPGTNYVGTSDAVELEIHVNSGNASTTSGDKRVMLYDPQPNSPNLIGGYQGNLPDTGSAIEGGTIGGGGKNNRVNEVKDNYGTIGGGAGNIAGGLGTTSRTDDHYATVGGGLDNKAQANSSTVGGGRENQAQGDYSTVGGGEDNQAQERGATVGGGENNQAQEEYSTVGGGENNQAQERGATVGGGENNQAQEEYSTVGGGENNQAQEEYSTVGGGENNQAQEEYSTVGGGENNQAQEEYSTVGGGYNNQAQERGATVGGGYNNQAQENSSTVGGGENNQAQEEYSTVGGGRENEAQEYYSTVGGGSYNQAQAVHSTVGGGNNNQARANFATVGGGDENQAQGAASAIPGGRYLTVGDNSFGYNGYNVTSNPSTTDLSSFSNIAYLGNVDFWIGNVDNIPRQLRFYVGNNGNFTYSGSTPPLYVGFKAPQALASTRTTGTLYTLPTDFPSTNGALLSSSTTGTLSWSTPSQDWALTGNGGTTPGTNYVGTSDATDLVIATSGTERIRVDTNGSVGIGTNNPDVSLDVDGGLAIRPPAVLTITQDNDTVDPGDRSFLQIDSDSTPANRTITLAAGSEGGQILVIQCTATGTDGIELLTSASTHTFTANKTLQGKDALTVIWNGLSSAWYEIGHTDF